ncbi:hypothetical protein [Micromonospora sp. ATA51]|uniref:hypothetical protein n=1 Tax=Micromonospora sp. ATA51 TaxID=2806098 RepID=UPI001A61814F|nr:hypothetical protein [Micromonospora sp. ATA51]MBM0228756.1 hypothetical protein [Micromonospora sp. ATA51]
MTTRLVLGAGVTLLGSLALVIAVVSVYRGGLTLAPVGLLGLALLGTGLATLGRRAEAGWRPPGVGGYWDRPASGPTGIVGFGVDVGGGEGGAGRPAHDGGSGGVRWGGDGRWSHDGRDGGLGGGGSGGDGGWSGGGN